MRFADRQYKDKIRHGGRREYLLNIFGPVCSHCGLEKEEKDITLHHLVNKDIHDFQILLCRSCHAKVHGLGVTGYSEEEKEELIQTLSSSATLEEVASKLNLSKSGLRYRRRKYGLFSRPCKICSKSFIPNRILLHFCSTICAALGFKKERHDYYQRKLLENPNFLKERYARNKEKDLQRTKKYAEDHKEELREYRKQYYLKKKVNQRAEVQNEGTLSING